MPAIPPSAGPCWCVRLASWTQCRKLLKFVLDSCARRGRGFAKSSTPEIVTTFSKVYCLVPLRIASASARSCGRPAASFDAMRSLAEMKFARRPFALSMTVSTRLSHAASKSTPGMAGRMSNLFGSRPKRKNVPASVKSSAPIHCNCAPNCVSAAYVAFAFSMSGFMKRSMSFVKRGCA